MSYSQASARYAKALHQVSAEKNNGPKVLDALRAIGKAVQTLGSEFDEAASPLVSVADKTKIFVEGLKSQNLPEEVLSLVGLLIEKKRLTLLPEITAAYQDYADQLNSVA